MRVVFIRLLQVLWVLSAVIIIGLMIAAFTTEDMLKVLAVVLFASVWLVVLIIVQYLVFGKLNPMHLFNSSLLERRYPR